MIVLMFQTQYIVLSSDSTEVRTFEERGIMFGIGHYNIALVPMTNLTQQ